MINGLIASDLQKKSDERGWFLKIFDGTESFRDQLKGDVYFVCSLDKGIRGNHYHLKTNEWFCVIKGNCQLHLVDLVTREKQILELKEETPKLIYVPCNVAHAFYGIDDCGFIVVAFTDTIFDVSDTIKYNVVNTD